MFIHLHHIAQSLMLVCQLMNGHIGSFRLVFRSFGKSSFFFGTHIADHKRTVKIKYWEEFTETDHLTPVQRVGFVY